MKTIAAQKRAGMPERQVNQANEGRGQAESRQGEGAPRKPRPSEKVEEEE